MVSLIAILLSLEGGIQKPHNLGAPNYKTHDYRAMNEMNVMWGMNPSHERAGLRNRIGSKINGMKACL